MVMNIALLQNLVKKCIKISTLTIFGQKKIKNDFLFGPKGVFWSQSLAKFCCLRTEYKKDFLKIKKGHLSENGLNVIFTALTRNQF